MAACCSLVSRSVGAIGAETGAVAAAADEDDDDDDAEAVDDDNDDVIGAAEATGIDVAGPARAGNGDFVSRKAPAATIGAVAAAAAAAADVDEDRVPEVDAAAQRIVADANGRRTTNCDVSSSGTVALADRYLRIASGNRECADDETTVGIDAS
jgi:hypothetical protein